MTNATALHVDGLQDRFGLKVAARLNENTAALSHDITERLRVARLQAVAARKKELRLQTAPSVTMQGGAAALGGGPNDGEGFSLWGSIASALPLLALAAGLIAVNMLQDEYRAKEIAEVDVQLLTDDLPPSAHTDPGFAQYLKFGPPGQ
jgi:Protein of unknown function (DUF3619)